jgi:hypothetical protein
MASKWSPPVLLIWNLYTCQSVKSRPARYRTVLGRIPGWKDLVFCQPFTPRPAFHGSVSFWQGTDPRDGRILQRSYWPGSWREKAVKFPASHVPLKPGILYTLQHAYWAATENFIIRVLHWGFELLTIYSSMFRDIDIQWHKSIHPWEKILQ